MTILEKSILSENEETCIGRPDFHFRDENMQSKTIGDYYRRIGKHSLAMRSSFICNRSRSGVSAIRKSLK